MNRSLAFLLLLLSVQSTWAADAGRVLLAGGNAVAIRGNQTIPLTRDSAVQEKDVLRTGPGSSLQVRFSDESLLSMRENSELSVTITVLKGAKMAVKCSCSAWSRVACAPSRV